MTGGTAAQLAALDQERRQGVAELRARHAAALAASRRSAAHLEDRARSAASTPSLLAAGRDGWWGRGRHRSDHEHLVPAMPDRPVLPAPPSSPGPTTAADPDHDNHDPGRNDNPHNDQRSWLR